MLTRCAAVLALLVAAIPLAAQAQTAEDPNVVIVWNDTLLKSITAVKVRSTVAARALAVVHTAMYDAWAEYDARAIPTRLPASLRRPPSEATEANKAAAVSYAAYRALLDLFPSELARYDAVMTRLGYEPDITASDTATPAGIGIAAAVAVTSYRHHDGSNQLGDLHPGAYSDYTGYAPRNDVAAIRDPDHWQPLATDAGAQTFLTPFWNRVTPFALKSGDALRPAPPAKISDLNAYKAQADRVIDFSAHLDDRSKALAEYFDFAGGESSSGQWNRFAEFVSKRDHLGLDANVKLFFILDNALFDAGIAIWDAKVAYDSVRPVTAIHYLYAEKPIVAWAGPGKGVATIQGRDWEPYLDTPPFAEYYSAHSGFAAAAAEVLRRYTRSDDFGYSATWKAGSSRVERGPKSDETFTWATYSQAVSDEGLSREFGGLHFTAAIATATTLGKRVGDLVWVKSMTLIAPEPSHQSKRTDVS
jgi:hypothetical protein